MKWEDVKKLIREGGLGLRSIRDMNSALQGKWLWRFTKKECKMWKRVVEATWGKEGGAVATKGSSRPHGLSLWKKIYGGCNRFSECLRWKSGNGACIKFRKDVWLGDTKLMDCFLSIFAHDKDMHVDKTYVGSGEGGNWSV